LQKEDGIRDGHVTGVQTCALPILRRNVVMIKNHREPRKCTEAFAADARSEVHALQIDRDGADQTDAVETEFDAAPGAKLLQHLHVVQNASGGFAGGSPEPFGVAMAV